MTLPELWQQAYLNAIRSGEWNSASAIAIADVAVREFLERFEWRLVGYEEYGYAPKPEWKP